MKAILKFTLSIIEAVLNSIALLFILAILTWLLMPELVNDAVQIVECELAKGNGNRIEIIYHCHIEK